ncbi:hypothetical protein C8Q70DRAFT_555151 [Cubamyces menziesii]|nr:hypothetical protein C8Q70DRAFT_555151 [Cubamyces menziesii]
MDVPSLSVAICHHDRGRRARFVSCHGLLLSGRRSHTVSHRPRGGIIIWSLGGSKVMKWTLQRSVLAAGAPSAPADSAASQRVARRCRSCPTQVPNLDPCVHPSAVGFSMFVWTFAGKTGWQTLRAIPINFKPFAAIVCRSTPQCVGVSRRWSCSMAPRSACERGGIGCGAWVCLCMLGRRSRRHDTRRSSNRCCEPMTSVASALCSRTGAWDVASPERTARAPWAAYVCRV